MNRGSPGKDLGLREKVDARELHKNKPGLGVRDDPLHSRLFLTFISRQRYPAKDRTKPEGTLPISLEMGPFLSYEE